MDKQYTNTSQKAYNYKLHIILSIVIWEPLQLPNVFNLFLKNEKNKRHSLLSFFHFYF